MRKFFKKPRKPTERTTFRKRFCRFCREKVKSIDYKDVTTLQKLITERGKIFPRRLSGNCAKHQRQVTEAVKKARFIALLPFVRK